MSVVSGISRLDLAVAWLRWRPRIEQRIVSNPPRSSIEGIAAHLVAEDGRRHLAAIDLAATSYIREHQSLETWWVSLAGERHRVQFHDERPQIAVESLGIWRRIMASVDSDALIALLALRAAPASEPISDIASRLRDWGTMPNVFDRDLRSLLSRGVADTHLHLEGSDPIPLLWVRCARGEMRLEELLRYQRRSTEGRWERDLIDQAFDFRRRQLSALSVAVAPIARMPEIDEERRFLLTAWRHQRSAPSDFVSAFDRYLIGKSLFLTAQQQFPMHGAGLQQFREFHRRALPALENRPRRVSRRLMVGRTQRLLRNILNYQDLQRVELRISPRETVDAWNETFRIWDRATADDGLHRRTRGARFVVHFGRRGGPNDTIEDLARQRSEIERHAAILHLFRHRGAENAARIVGLDVASSERDTPPDRFIPYLKMLRGNTSELDREDSIPSAMWRRLRERNLHGHSFALPRLGQTFHVGEDVYHLVTGLRHIDLLVGNLLEAGDRIGHGLVLGLEPGVWIATNQDHLQIPRGVVLDDCVWLHRALPQIAADKVELTHNLERQISRLSQEVYGDTITPQTLGALALERTHLPPRTRAGARHRQLYWAECNDAAVHARRMQLVSDAAVDVLNSNAGAIRQAQVYVTRLLAQRGIVIEINPTSNLATGMISSLSQHPVFSVLRDAGEGARISINTDDPGVFATRLDWEFGLIFHELLTSQGVPRHEALAQLERFRQAGIESAF